MNQIFQSRCSDEIHKVRQFRFKRAAYAWVAWDLEIRIMECILGH